MVDALPRRRDPRGGRRRPSSPRWRPRSRTAYEQRFELLDFTGALERVWELVRALNRFVESRAPWELAKSDEPGAAAALDETLATLCEGVRVLAVLLWPFLPVEGAAHAGRDRRGGRRRRLRARGARQRQRPAGRRVGRVALPARRRARGVIDTHAHLQGLEGGADGGDRGGRGGRRRAHRLRRRLARARARRRSGSRARTRASSRRSGCTRIAPSSGTTRVRARLDALLGDPAAVAVGECGLDYYRERASRAAQATAFAGQVELAERHGKPLVIHTREAADDTLAVLRETSCAVVLHCFSLPEHLDEVVERGWYVSFAGNVTYPSATRARRGRGAACRPSCCCSRPTARTSRRCRTAASPTGPRYVLETLRAVAAMRGVARRRAGGAGRGERRARLRPAVSAPRQVTLARLAELGLRPDSELGQHFLVDDNLLGVIERLAALEPGDVALEIGAGVGTLTARLAGALRARARGRDRPAPRAGARRARWRAATT